MLGFCAGLPAAPKSEVPAKYHTPCDLYLTPHEAHAMKLARADSLLFIDVRTRAELKYVGMADAVDANIPVRLLRGDYAWSERANTFRTRENPEFVAAVERLLDSRGLDRGRRVVNGWKNAGLPWRYALDRTKMYFNFAP